MFRMRDAGESQYGDQEARKNRRAAERTGVLSATSQEFQEVLYDLPGVLRGATVPQVLKYVECSRSSVTSPSTFSSEVSVLGATVVGVLLPPMLAALVSPTSLVFPMPSSMKHRLTLVSAEAALVDATRQSADASF